MIKDYPRLYQQGPLQVSFYIILTSLHHSLIIYYFLTQQELLGSSRFSPYPRLRLSRFSKESWFFFCREWCLKTKIWTLGMLIALVILVLLGPFRALSQETYACVYTYGYVYTCMHTVFLHWVVITKYQRLGS